MTQQLEIEKYLRKVRPVEAVKVTEDNLNQVANWCGGLVVPAGSLVGSETKETYIHVTVRFPRKDSDSQATVGSWIVREDFRWFRVVPNKQFRNGYDLLNKPKPAGPSPKEMPQKQTVTPDPSGLTELTPEPVDVHEARVEQIVHRSAESGEFVTEAEADANPATTVEETIEKESNVQGNEMNGAVTPDEDDVVADELTDDGVVPGDLVDPEAPEEDEDGTVQLGVPIEGDDPTPELCGSCGSQVVDGVCSKDIDHDVNGTAATPRIVPGD